MTSSQVKQLLKANNLRYRDVGRRWKVTPQMVSDFINRKTKSARLERRLAQLIEDLKGKEEKDGLL
jgi:predicted XRE-type DNA-binding protein